MCYIQVCPCACEEVIKFYVKYPYYESNKNNYWRKTYHGFQNSFLSVVDACPEASQQPDDLPL